MRGKANLKLLGVSKKISHLKNGCSNSVIYGFKIKHLKEENNA